MGHPILDNTPFEIKDNVSPSPDEAKLSRDEKGKKPKKVESLDNGKGILHKQKKEQGSKNPNFRGLIVLNNRKFTLTGWINKTKKDHYYVSLSVSERISESSGEDITKKTFTYKKIGEGYLRPAKQDKSNEPPFRGQITLNDQKVCYTLSAWKKDSDTINLNSLPMIQVNGQEELKRWSDDMNGE